MTGPRALDASTAAMEGVVLSPGGKGKYGLSSHATSMAMGVASIAGEVDKLDLGSGGSGGGGGAAAAASLERRGSLGASGSGTSDYGSERWESDGKSDGNEGAYEDSTTDGPRGDNEKNDCDGAFSGRAECVMS